VKEEPDWDRDEIIVCMVGAFCLGNALITVIIDSSAKAVFAMKERASCYRWR